MYNESHILQSISRGDEKAFNQLYEQHWYNIYRYLYTLVKSPEVAEEMVIDIFVKLWDGRGWLEQVQNVGGFLRITARNKALDYLKLTAKKKKLISDYYADMLVMNNHILPEDRILNSETNRIWLAALSNLSPNRRKVFLMHREEGLSYNEIAEIMEISPLTVKKTMSVALSSIRAFLKSNYKESLAAYCIFILL